MAVQVSEICDRCGRSTPVQLDNDSLVLETEIRQSTERACKEVEAFIREMDPNTLPTIMVIYRREDGTLLIKSQIKVCNPKEEGKRSCAKRVEELVGDLFPIPADERAPRAPRKPKNPDAPKKEKK